MNIRHHNIHPVELLRLKEGLTQGEFAKKLRLDSQGQYHRYLNCSHWSLLLNIREEYGLDISQEVIAFLNSKLRAVSKQLREHSRSRNHRQATVNATQTNTDAISSLDGIITNIK